MYIGHLALSLAGKKLRPEVPLAVLAVATILPDWVDAAFGLVGVAAPISFHTPVGALVLTAIVGVLGAVSWNVRAGVLLGTLTLSHQLADYVTSVLPGWSEGSRWGLHLYHWRVPDLLVEAALITGCWLVYRRSLPVESRGRWPAVAMLGLLLLLQAIFDLGTNLGA